jgi:NAD(P)-dependent dehydrogenase (short-subunit alcohol dehydrogenase family)
MKHTNKIAFVTGASRGLGRATALKLAHDGADVIVTYRERKDEGESVVAAIEKLGRKAALLQLDVAKTGSFDPFARTLSETLKTEWQRNNFDFLINNAGIDVYSPFAET